MRVSKESERLSGRRLLRSRLEQKEILLLAGAPNALFARMLETVGFEAIYATGAGIANMSFAVPDIGLVSRSETVEEAERIIAAVTVPTIVDADTGYGGPLNVMRTIQQVERAGAAGIQLEDQAEPKRCGHFAGKRVVDPLEMVLRIEAARSARRDPDLVLIARTDALAEFGLQNAIDRVNRYLAAGADIAFVEAPRRIEDVARIPREVDGPVLMNMVEGGLTPLLGASELERMGYRIALFANTALRLAIPAVIEGMHQLRRTGSSEDLVPRMASWEERQRLVNLGDFQTLEDQLMSASHGRSDPSDPAPKNG